LRGQIPKRQEAINDNAGLKVIDGFRGSVGYDLDNLDTASGPIRERVYEIICANLEPGSLLLQSLRQINNAVEDMPLYEWVLEMDAIYFDINPEMGQRRFEGHEQDMDGGSRRHPQEETSL
jgi:hypothetical protein